MGKRISHCQGKGSLAHNNRTFTPKNVDPERMKDNIVLVRQPIAEAYEECFGQAVREYNAKQTRKDRKVDENYFRHLFGREACNTVCTGANKQKSFYEDLVQIGTMEDTGVGTKDAEIAKECLLEYWRGFQERNPNLHVFNAVLHMDEATPHLHIDHIPLGHYARGLSVQNGLAQALKEMGFGSGIDSISKWRMAERKVFEDICRSHGIDVEAPKKARGHSFTVEEYKTIKEDLKEAQRELEGVQEQIAEAEDKLSSKLIEILDADDELEKYRNIKDRIRDIDSIEVTEKGFRKDRVELSADNWERVKEVAKKDYVFEKQIYDVAQQNRSMQQRINQQEASLDRLVVENRKLRNRNEQQENVIEELKEEKAHTEAFLAQHGLLEKFREWMQRVREEIRKQLEKQFKRDRSGPVR